MCVIKKLNVTSEKRDDFSWQKAMTLCKKMDRRDCAKLVKLNTFITKELLI